MGVLVNLCTVFVNPVTMEDDFQVEVDIEDYLESYSYSNINTIKDSNPHHDLHLSITLNETIKKKFGNTSLNDNTICGLPDLSKIDDGPNQSRLI